MANKTEFSKILRKLREDKRISQKNVAKDLGISQALLSHYEKGVRECGLSFLIKAAKYYGVTADYLLGLGLTAEAEKDNKYDDCSCFNNYNNKKENNYAVLYKNLIINTADYIFGNMKAAEYKQTAQISGEYMILSMYSLYKYIADTTGAELNSYEEIEAAKAKIIVELTKNKQYLKNADTNEYIKCMLKNGANIINNN